MSEWVKECPSKKQIYSRMGALYAILRIQREKPEGHHEFRSYKCPKCGKWHLSSKPKYGGMPWE